MSPGWDAHAKLSVETRSSAVAERPRHASCHWIFWSSVGQAAVSLLEYAFEEMRHPPYSPDQTPNDIDFLTDDKLKYAAKEWLNGQSELFYFTGIKKSSL